jgi:hypothetical protein
VGGPEFKPYYCQKQNKANPSTAKINNLQPKTSYDAQIEILS